MTDRALQPCFLVLSGDGINCERETARAFELAGAQADIMHINDVITAPKRLKAYDGLAIPGGFSFGDELGSGQLLALKIKHQLGDAFHDFVAAKKPVIGICNGFQVLVKLGLLPYPDGERIAALAHNESGRFIDRWIDLDVVPESVCVWTRGLERAKLALPVRHGEGRIVLRQDCAAQDFEVLRTQGQIPFFYGEDINGSYQNIAALCDPTGLILGMMPHPEAFVSNVTAPQRTADVFGKGDGLLLFENIVAYLQERETGVSRDVKEGRKRHA